MRRHLARSIAPPSLLVLLFVCVIAPPLAASAQDASTDTAGYAVRAVVTEVTGETVTARVLDGTEKGKTVEFQTSGIPQGEGQAIQQGDTIYVSQYVPESNAGGAVYPYQFIDHYRLPVVIFFIALFIGCIVLIGGKQGVRGLVSLLGGICFIVFVLIPGILHGYSPLLLSVIIASFIASVGAYITHGFSKMTTAAAIGMILTILIATLLANIAVHLGYLSGTTDEVAFNLTTNPNFASINFQGILLGGIIIGLLGVLYDAAIGQAVAVEELIQAAPHLSRRVIFGRASRIGREHIGALVNTLVLAYVGTSMPIILSLYGISLTDPYWPPVLNWEFVATEIIRTTVGGIGLMLAVPITTLIAVWILMPKSTVSHPV